MKFDYDEWIEYEIAQDTVGYMISMQMKLLCCEWKKPVPDEEKIRQLKQEVARLHHEQMSLRFEDKKEIARILEEYCPIVRAAVAANTQENDCDGESGELPEWLHNKIYDEVIAPLFLGSEPGK